MKRLEGSQRGRSRTNAFPQQRNFSAFESAAEILSRSGDNALACRYFFHWKIFAITKMQQAHLKSAAVIMERHNKEELIFIFYLRWLRMTERRREAICQPTLVERVVLFPTPRDLVMLARRYFQTWRRWLRLSTQRKRGLLAGCGVRSLPPNLLKDFAFQTEDRSQRVVYWAVNRARPIFYKWKQWAALKNAAAQASQPSSREKQQQKQLEDAEKLIHQLREALWEETAKREQLQHTLNHTLAALEGEKELREKEKKDRIRDLEALREEFSELQQQNLRDLEAERRASEAQQERRQCRMTSASPQPSGLFEVSDSSESFEDPTQRSTSKRWKHVGRQLRFPISAFKQACEAYRKSQEESLLEARGWLEQLNSNLIQWNSVALSSSTRRHEGEEDAKDGSGTSESISDEENRWERRRKAHQRRRSVIYLARSVWQEGLRLIHGLQYLQNAADGYTQQYRSATKTQKSMGVQGSELNPHTSPFDHLVDQLKAVQQDVVCLRLAASNAVHLLTPETLPPMSSRGETSVNGTQLSNPASREPVRLVSLPATFLSEILLLHTQQLIYAYERCCDSLCIPRTPPVCLPTEVTLLRYSDEKCKADLLMSGEMKEQMRAIEQAGFHFQAACAAQREVMTMLDLSLQLKGGGNDSSVAIADLQLDRFSSKWVKRDWTPILQSLQVIVRQHRSAHILLFRLLSLLKDPMQQRVDNGPDISPQQLAEVVSNNATHSPESSLLHAVTLKAQIQDWFGVPCATLAALIPFTFTKVASLKDDSTPVFTESPFATQLIFALQESVENEIAILQGVMHQQLPFLAGKCLHNGILTQERGSIGEPKSRSMLEMQENRVPTFSDILTALAASPAVSALQSSDRESPSYALQTRLEILEAMEQQHAREKSVMEEENRSLRAELVRQLAKTAVDLQTLRSHLQQRSLERESMEREEFSRWEQEREVDQREREAAFQRVEKCFFFATKALTDLMRFLWMGKVAEVGKESLSMYPACPSENQLRHIILADVEERNRDGVASVNAKGMTSTKSSSHLQPYVDSAKKHMLQFLSHLQNQVKDLRQIALDTRSSCCAMQKAFSECVCDTGSSLSLSAPLTDFIQRFEKSEIDRFAVYEKEVKKHCCRSDRLQQQITEMEKELSEERRRQHQWREKVLSLQAAVALQDSCSTTQALTQRKENISDATPIKNSTSIDKEGIGESLAKLGKNSRSVREAYADTIESTLLIYRSVQQAIFYMVQAYQQKFLPLLNASKSLRTVFGLPPSIEELEALVATNEGFVETVIEQMNQLELLDQKVRRLWCEELPLLSAPFCLKH